MSKPLNQQCAPGTGPGSAGWAARPLFVCLLLAGITLAVFWPVVGYDYTNYDDPGYVSANSHVLTGLTRENVAWAFRTGHMGYWQPVTWLSFMLDMELFGTGPRGPHATNLLLHAANSVLLFLLLRRMTCMRWRSAGVAALFALHPLRVESVAWVCERRDMLSMFFGLLALWAYVRYAKGERRMQNAECRSQATAVGNTQHATRNGFHLPSTVFYLLALAFFALGLMSKPMMVTLPFVMLLLDCWPLRRFGPSTRHPQLSTSFRLILEKAPFFLLTGIFCAITFLAQRNVGAVASLATFPFAARVGNAFVSYARYLAKTFWPVALANPYPNPWHWPLGHILFAAALVVGLCAAALWSRRELPFVFTGWFWFCGTLIPVIGLVQAGEQPLADRFTYFPSVGLFMILVWGWGELVERWRPTGVSRLLVWVLPVAVLAASSVRTADQLRYWKNSEAMFRHAVEVTEGNYIAYNNLGALLEGQGALDQAIAYYVEALRFKPDFAQAHNNLGQALTTTGQLDEAQVHLSRALQIDPTWAGTHNNLGNLLLRQGKREEAIAAYRQALALEVDLPDAHNNLGCLLSEQGKLAEATIHFQNAVRSRPNFPDALNNLGTMLTEQGRAAEAVAPLTQATRLKPAWTEAHYNLGNAYLALKKPQEALAEYQTVLRLKPSHSLAQYKVANLFLDSGNPATAIEHYRAALAVNPKHAEAHYQLATLLVQRKQVEEGNQHYREALRLKPNWVEPLNNLAWLLATYPEAKYRDGAEAVRLAAHAAELTRNQDAEALDTLAAALAEAGRFPEAFQAAQAAMTEARTAGRTNLASQISARLSLYQAHSPYHEGGP